MASNSPTLSPRATFLTPQLDDTPTSLLNRWSNTYLSLPAAVAVPYTEGDIAALVAYSKQQNLSIVVSGGGHLPSVPVTSKTLYMDMKNFNEIRIDEEANTVSFGGGVTTGSLLEALAAAGYYTSLPNTNSVGMVGAFIGGGSSGLNSVTGFMIDQAVAIRVVTASGKTLTLGPDSEGDNASLWHALRGAGHGLAAVCELTLRIYPISNLGMDDNKIWSRTIVFPAPAVGLAARIFAKLQPVRGPIALNLLIMRSPPGTPAPGSPIIVLTVAYFGPSTEAEKALATLLDPEVECAAVQATTSFLPMAAVNDGTKMTEVRGGLKRSDATLLQEPVDAATIERSYERFLQLGDDCPDAMHGAVVYFAFDARVLSSGFSNGFFESHETRCIVYHDIWFGEAASVDTVGAYLPEAIDIARSNETGPMRRFANFLPHPADLSETYSGVMIAEKKRVKKVYDPENVFWTPGL